MGNTIFTTKSDAEQGGTRDESQNLTDLSRKFDTKKYLSPHSDLVALLVLEHQADLHNRLAQATLETRIALADQTALNKELGEPATKEWESTSKRINNMVERLVDAIVCIEERPLEAGVKGTSGFAESFIKRGPFDSKGRSLRDLDLQTRLLKYPCSYLIYTSAFNQLPERVRSATLYRLHELLTTEQLPEKYKGLAKLDRKATLEILTETLPNLPSDWKKPAPKVASK